MFRKAHFLISDSNQGLLMNTFRRCTTKCSNLQNNYCVDKDNTVGTSQKPSKPSGSDETLTTETRDATTTLTATESSDTRDQPAPLTRIFDEKTTPTTTRIPDVRSQPRNKMQGRQVGHTTQAHSHHLAVTRKTHRTCDCRGAGRVSSH